MSKTRQLKQKEAQERTEKYQKLSFEEKMARNSKKVQQKLLKKKGSQA